MLMSSTTVGATWNPKRKIHEVHINESSTRDLKNMFISQNKLEKQKKEKKFWENIWK